MAEHDTILVTGATGNVGRQVVSQLMGTGAAVRAMVRNPGMLNVYARMVTNPASPTTTVHEITGTPGRTFRDWAVDHADDFRRSPADA